MDDQVVSHSSAESAAPPRLRHELSTSELSLGQAMRQAEKLDEQAMEDSLLTAAARQSPIGSADWNLSLAIWVRLAKRRESDDAFLTHVCEWIGKYEDAITCSQCLTLANWIGYSSAGDSSRLPSSEVLEKANPMQKLFLAAVPMYRRYALYQFDDLETLVRELPRDFPHRPLFDAMLTFALMGLGKDREALLRMNQALRHDQVQCDGSCYEHLVDICTKGLDISDSATIHSELVIATVSQLLEDKGVEAPSGVDANIAAVLYLRRARARRRQIPGHASDDRSVRQLIHSAREDLNSAHSLLRDDTDFVRDFNTRIRAERDAIETEVRATQLEGMELRLQKEVSMSSIRMVEIIGLSVSAVAFVVSLASISTRIRDQNVALTIGAFIFVGLLLFAALTLLVGSSVSAATKAPISSPRGPRRLLDLYQGATIFALVLAGIAAGLAVWALLR